MSKAIYTYIVVTCDNCGDIIIEGDEEDIGIGPLDYVGPHQDQKMDECDDCHEVCIAIELEEEEEELRKEEEEKVVRIIPDGHDSDLSLFF